MNTGGRQEKVLRTECVKLDIAVHAVRSHIRQRVPAAGIDMAASYPELGEVN